MASSVATLAVAKHNILFVMTDDQDVELGGLTPMPKMRERLGEQGAVGEAFYIATPICGPSRTETYVPHARPGDLWAVHRIAFAPLTRVC
jgi:hypothetical protein